jgi:hypothetical protein
MTCTILKSIFVPYANKAAYNDLQMHAELNLHVLTSRGVTPSADACRTEPACTDLPERDLFGRCMQNWTCLYWLAGVWSLQQMHAELNLHVLTCRGVTSSADAFRTGPAYNWPAGVWPLQQMHVELDLLILNCRGMITSANACRTEPACSDLQGCDFFSRCIQNWTCIYWPAGVWPLQQIHVELDLLILNCRGMISSANACRTGPAYTELQGHDLFSKCM